MLLVVLSASITASTSTSTVQKNFFSSSCLFFNLISCNFLEQKENTVSHKPGGFVTCTEKKKRREEEENLLEVE